MDDALPEPAFRRTRLRRGYRRDEVDPFVVQLRRAVTSQPPGMAPYEVADQRFGGARFGRGYDMRAVDDYLAEAQSLLRQRHGGDAVADLEGQPPRERHRAVLWVYAVAALAVAALVVFAVTQL